MNDRTRSSVSRWLGVLITTVVLVACSPSAEPAIPTRVPAPTFTPTAEIQAPGSDVDPAVAAAAATAQAEALATQAAAAAAQSAPTQAPDAPTQAPAVGPTPTLAQAAEVVISSQANIRGGPGTNYNIVGAANAGEHYPITGKNNDASWWEINFNGQKGWVFGQLVTAQNVQQVAIANDIPAPPPTAIPQPTPVPQPQATQPPAQAQPTQPPAPPADNFPFKLGTTDRCDPNKGNAYFQGFVRDASNNLMNGVCIHIAFYGDRGTKCSGCDGVGDGIWGFSPFGGPSKGGEPIEIYVVQCPGPMPLGGQTEQSGFGDLTPQSPKWLHTMNGSEQCTGITFYKK